MESKEITPEEDALLAGLENYFAEPAFTESIHEWMNLNCPLVDLVPLEEEQPLHTFELFTSYSGLISSQLEEFLAAQGASGEAMVIALQKAQATGVALSCLDFILAGVDYEDFLNIVADFKGASSWTEGADEAGDEDDDKV